MLDWREVLIRLVLAAFFGSLIGFERERKRWAAGLRTHMMVCVGSALIMMVSAFGFFDILGSKNVVLDPSRVAAQVVSGIGFIGAGTILFLKQGIVRGLTTAAGLWTVAAIGLATGGGMYFAASATTVVALIILWGIQPLEKIYFKKNEGRTLRIVLSEMKDLTNILDKIKEVKKINLQNFSFEKEEESYVVEMRFANLDLSELTEIVNSIRKEVEVREIFWS